MTIKGFATNSGGKSHPIHTRKGITEDQMKISVKGNNDTISVGKSVKGMKDNNYNDYVGRKTYENMDFPEKMKKLIQLGGAGEDAQKSWNELPIKVKNAFIKWSNKESSTIIPKNTDEFDISNGTTFFHNGKAYWVTMHPLSISVNEMYQDNNNKWHKRVTNGFFVQHEDKEMLVREAGGEYIDKIIKYLDSAGALPSDLEN